MIVVDLSMDEKESATEKTQGKVSETRQAIFFRIVLNRRKLLILYEEIGVFKRPSNPTGIAQVCDRLCSFVSSCPFFALWNEETTIRSFFQDPVMCIISDLGVFPITRIGHPQSESTVKKNYPGSLGQMFTLND